MQNSGKKILSSEQFWRYSLSLYPAIKDLCLQWQDNYGVNINLLLFLLYLDKQQQSVSEAQLLQLEDLLKHFSTEVTQSIRALRRTLPSPWLESDMQQPLRQQLLNTELAAEKLEQQLLVQQFNQLGLTDDLLPYSQLLDHYLVLIQAPVEQLDAEILDLYQQSQQLESL
ncbi:TIGR02444 family protein [Rheinheimera sp. A13L]|uniref:TIGR02444 family protein n=1 Tax=Rheinheimera sp. A13L TaxID=506534 RepID=UPI0002124C2D|nr:TIGR02444 family protein [Rheinheimera sp. A13L]EGM77092.1 TIGR02444 family protein [Rheinheimera sp. A13L]